MQVFGLTIGRRDGEIVVARTKKLTTPTLRPPTSSGSLFGGWWPVIRESFAGAWQRNIETPLVDVLSFGAVFSCVTLIASDIAKMRLRLMSKDDEDIWTETNSPSFSPVLRKPNHYQIRIMFIMQWVISKLTHGNTYILKARDSRRVVTELYVLDPCRVQVLLAPDGSVFYQLAADDLAGVTESVAVPATEIIHDVMYPLYHPLVGISPISACGLAAMQGLRIQQNSAKFFGNGSQPGGILTAPGAISDATAKRLKDYWDANYTGDNVGKIAVLGDNLKFEGLTVKAEDAQLIEQLRWTGENVCGCYHVPAYKVGIGTPPAYNNIEALDQAYYSQALQILIECIEALLDDGLALPANYGTEFDLDDLLRMDSATLMEVVTKGISGAVFTPNEGRKKFNLRKVAGGATPYMQQQNYSLAALDARDRANPAPSSVTTDPTQVPAPPKPGDSGTGLPPPRGKSLDIELADAEFLRKLSDELARKVGEFEYV
jgi:HK97 family phage portal protein